MAEKPESMHSLQLAELLDSQRETASLTDVTLVCGGRDFPAHKMILSATSNYFRALFAPGSEENTSARITLPSVSEKEMEIILPFLYTGKFKDVGELYLLEALLASSHLLQINTLFECCYRKLVNRLTCNSFIHICNLAFQYNDEGMIMHVTAFLAQNIEDVEKSEEFLKLNPSQILKICQHPDTLKSSMDVIIGGFFRWTEVDEGREETMLKILTILDLKRLSNAFLSENLRERALVKKSCHILTLLTAEATSRMLILSSKNLEDANEPKVLTFGTKDGRQVFRMYDIKQNQWLSPKILPFHFELGMAVVWFNGHVFFIGAGEISNTGPSNKVIKYCPATNAIASFGNLDVAVRQAGAGLLYEHIYVVNGLNEKSQCVTTVQRYNPVTNHTNMVAQTNNRHNFPYVLPFDKYLLVLGSYKEQNSIERYDPESDSWTVITAIPGAIEWCSSAIYGGKLFIVPTRVTSDFQIYDFLANIWEQKQFDGCPDKIFGLFPTLFNGKIILLVRDGKGVLHYLDPEENTWIKKSNSNLEPWGNWQNCLI